MVPWPAGSHPDCQGGVGETSVTRTRLRRSSSGSGKDAVKFTAEDSSRGTQAVNYGLLFLQPIVMHPMLNTAVKAARRAGAINQPRQSRHRPPAGVSKRSKRFRDRGSTRPARLPSSKSSRLPIPATASWARRLAEPSVASPLRIGQTTSGSSTPSMAPPTSFMHAGLWVSIALMQKEQITQAVVYDPSRDELFVALQRQGRIP